MFLPGPYVVCTSEWAILRPYGAVLLSKNTLVGAPSYGVHGFCLTWVLDGSDNFIRSYTVEAVNCKDMCISSEESSLFWKASEGWELPKPVGCRF